MADQKLTDRNSLTQYNSLDEMHVVRHNTSFKMRLGVLEAQFGGNTGSSPDANSAIGTIVYTGTGLVYDCSTSRQTINSTVYTQLISANKTLGASHATLDRYDAVVAQISALGVVSIEVVAGTASATPVIGDLDLTTQSLIGTILVVAASTTDGTITSNLIYNENVGTGGGEWDVTTEPDTNTAYAVDPYDGTLSCLVDAAADTSTITSTNTLAFTDNVNATFNSADTLNFAYRADWNGGAFIQIKLIDSSTGKFYLKTINDSNINDFGILDGVGTWQLCQISLSAFQTISNITTYDRIEFNFAGTPATQLDKIFIQGNVSISNTGTTSSLPFSQISGLVTQLGTGNPVFVEGYNDSGLTVNFIRSGAGEYTWNILGETIVAEKIFVSVGSNNATTTNFVGVTIGENSVTLKTTGDAVLALNALEIKLY
tara:strand:- start:52 stop:1338 length:1287 start_codon:yes stop_codon:yes gene_type:complete